MATETLPLPQFDAETAHNVINDLAERARESENRLGEYRNMPHELRKLEEHKLFMAMAEVRASERLAGRNVDSWLHSNGSRQPDPGNIQLDFHIHGQDDDDDHEFSQNDVTLNAGPARLDTTVAELARIRGLTSLDVLNLIGEPTSEHRGDEGPKQQIERYITELTHVHLYKTKNPEATERMDQVATKLVKRLIELRKTEPGRFSIGFQVTDIKTGQGNLLFTDEVRDPKSIWSDPWILDINGELSSSIPAVPATDELEEEIAADIVGEYVTIPGVKEYDFWTIPLENGGVIITWNTSNDPKKVEMDDWAA